MTDATRSELRTGAAIAASVLLAGIPVAVVWWLLAPVPELTVAAGGVLFPQGETESAVAADGWFAICTATAGLVAALAVFARARRTRVGALLGLTVGGLAAALVAWRLGVLLGPGAALTTARHLAVGARFDGPLELSALGVLFAWPIASVVAFFALTAGLEPASLDAHHEAADGPPFPVTVLRPGYAIDEVDEVFRRLDAGEVSAADARGVRFSPTRWNNRGYDEASVDAALAARTNGRAPDQGQGRGQGHDGELDVTGRDPAGGSVPRPPG